MFYKIPKNTDLSNTSVRCAKNKDDYTYIEYNEGFIGDDWIEISEDEILEIAPEWFEEPEEKEETQLDRIESTVNDIAKNNTSYAEMAAAIAEGVNDIEW